MSPYYSYLLAFAAIWCFGCGVYWWRRTLRRQSRWIHARGDVIALKEHADVDNVSTYAPVVRFITDHGEEFTITNALGWNKSDSYLVGERVDVLFNPDDPNDAVVDDWSSMWAMVVIAFSLGTIFSLIAWATW